MNHRQRLINKQMGFFDIEKDLPILISEDRLQPVLVRCGAGRFSCPAQDVWHFIKIIENDGSDYVRDVSVYTLNKG